MLDSPPRNGNVSQEFRLLCACAGSDLSAERVARIADCPVSGLDWNEVLRMAEYHGVLPLMARNLQTHARDLPPQIAQFLRSAFETNLRRNLWFASELVRIADHFHEKKLHAVPYKGPVLAESAYGDLALRNFSDLDFLISPSDFDAAKRVLAELGYQPSTEMRPAVERFWLRKGYECSFDSAAGKYLVELQWGILPYFYAVDLRVEGLLARSGRAAVGGREVSCLSAEDSLIVLCLHAAKHLWMRMIWVCDIAESLRTQTVDWAAVVARARSLGILRIMGVGFWLIRELLNASLPPAAQRIVADDPEIGVIGKEFADRLARGAVYDFDSPEYFRFILRLRERRRDRWRYGWRLLWTPGPGDLAALQLPEAMFPLYRVVRAWRLIWKLA